MKKTFDKYVQQHMLRLFRSGQKDAYVSVEAPIGLETGVFCSPLYSHFVPAVCRA